MATVEMIPNGELDFAEAKTEDGRLSGKPVFYGAGRDEANIATIVMKSEKGEVLRRYLLRVDGATSKLSLQERSAPVLGAFEQPPAPGKVEKPNVVKTPALT